MYLTRRQLQINWLEIVRVCNAVIRLLKLLYLVIRQPSIPYIVHDREFWTQVDQQPVAGPNVNQVEKVPFINQDVVNLRFQLLW